MMNALSISFGLFLFMAFAYADSPTPSEEIIPQTLKSFRCTLRHIEPQGIGYHDGYTTFESFLMLRQPLNHRWLPFLDGRAHLFNNGKWAANAGLGLRYQHNRIWGGNLYYDYRQDARYSYHQVSAGLESLGPRWDFRLNSYFPVAQTTHTRVRFDRFHQHYAVLTRRRESALTGFEAEVGTHVQIGHRPWYFAEGVYYLTGHGSSTWGGQARLAIDLFDYMRIEGNTSYDSLFKWIAQGQLSFIFPFGARHASKKRSSQSLIMNERALQNVGRHEIIPIDVHYTQKKAINPLTGDPYLFWFVDNTSHSQGTFESPFNTLLDAQDASLPHDILYLFPGDGTSANMDQGIVLKANQKLWGSSIAHALDTSWGTISIPLQSSVMPTISNTSGDGVTLASHNEISGIMVSRAAGYGITGVNPGPTTIQDAVVFASGNDGVFISQDNGSIPVSLARVRSTLNNNNGLTLSLNNDAFLDLTIADSAFTGNLNNGLLLQPTDNAVVIAQFTHNQFLVNSIRGIGIDDTTTSSTPSYYTFQNNLIINNYNGNFSADFFNPSAPIIFTFSGNRVMSNYDPVGLSFAGPHSTFSASHNTIQYNNGSFYLSNNANSPFTATFKHNLLLSNAEGIHLEGGNSAALELLIEHNQIIDNKLRGIFLFGSDFGPSQLSIKNNTIACNNAIAIACAGTFDTLSANISHNKIDRNNGTGLQIDASVGDLLVQLQNNQITNHNDSAVNFNGTYTGSVNLTIADNNISGNAGNGIRYPSSSNPSYATIANNNISYNSDTGLDITNGPFSDIHLMFSGNTLLGNALGLHIHTASADPVYLNSDQNTFIGTIGSPIYIENTFLAQCFLTNSIIEGNYATTGLEISPATIAYFELSDCQIRYNATGVSLYDITLVSHPITSQSYVRIDSNDISSNNLIGLELASFTLNDPLPSMIPFTVSNNTICANRVKGIDIEIEDNGSAIRTLEMTLQSNTTSYNQGIGTAITWNTSNTVLALSATLANTISKYNNDYGIQITNGGQSNLRMSATENLLFSNRLDATGSFFLESLSTGSTCLNLQLNTSDTGYYLNNADTLTPFTLILPRTNSGTIYFGPGPGTITSNNSCL